MAKYRVEKKYRFINPYTFVPKDEFVKRTDIAEYPTDQRGIWNAG